MHGIMESEMINLGKLVDEFIISGIMSCLYAIDVKEIPQLVS